MKKIIAIIAVLFILPSLAAARIGVGIATGKITVDQKLKPGLIYSLPSLTVINTGDEPSEYGVKIAYREKQREIQPPKEWLSFEPTSFTLEPGKVQVVKIKMTLPVKGVKPGDYFAFLQAYPNKTASNGGTNIGIAAAAKLYFSVESTNIFMGVYYRAISLYSSLYPWSLIFLVIVSLAVVVAIFRKYFSFNIGINVRKK